MKLFDSLTALERSLDARGRRHEVLATDLANADTPGFAPLDLDLSQAVSAAAEGALRQTNAKHLGGSSDAAALEAAPSTELAGAPSLDGNSVDLDKTLAALAENGLQYAAAARAAGKKLAMLRYVASDGVG